MTRHVVFVTRQCDGIYSDIGETPRCNAAVALTCEYLTVHTEDDRRRQTTDTVNAWEAAATTLGWFRLHGVGTHDIRRDTDAVDGTLVIPSTRVWVSCPACSAQMKLQRIRCVGGVGIDGEQP